MCCQIPTAPNISICKIQKEKRKEKERKKGKKKVKYERWFDEPPKKFNRRSECKTLKM